MVPFWMKLGTEVSDGVWVAPGSVKYTEDCFQLGSVSVDHGQKEQNLPFLPSFSTLLCHHVPHHDQRPSPA